MSRAGRVGAALAALALAAGCGPSDALEDWPCTEAGQALTWEEFGGPFMETWCQRCHGGAVGERRGAPSGYDFGTVEAVRRWDDRIFARAAAGNTTMPLGPDDPPEAARDRLADWLACGAP